MGRTKIKKRIKNVRTKFCETERRTDGGANTIIKKNAVRQAKYSDNENLPETLYHYCGINTVKGFILDKQVRFSSLEILDDPEEPVTLDIGNYGRHYYSSSWIGNEKESKQMWNNYGKKGMGFRIEISSDLIDLKLMMGYCFITEDFQLLPYIRRIKVRYDDSKVTPNVLKRGLGMTIIEGSELGVIKSTKWEYQEEIRFLILISPPMKAPNALLSSHPDLHRLREYLKGTKRYADYYFLPLNKDSLNKMRILIGPRTPDFEVNQIKKMIQKGKMDIQLTRSKLIWDEEES